MHLLEITILVDILAWSKEGVLDNRPEENESGSNDSEDNSRAYFDTPRKGISAHQVNLNISELQYSDG